MTAFESVIAILAFVSRASATPRELANVECDKNPAPLMILICLLIVWMGIYLASLYWDKSQRPLFFDPQSISNMTKDATGRPPAQPIAESGAAVINDPPRQGASSSSDSSKGKGEYTDNYYLAQSNVSAPVKKTKLGEILEGHLTLGLYLYREDFPRALRVLTIIAIWVFELVMIAIIFRNLETTLRGDDNMNSGDIGDEYSGEYFAYAIYALLICIPLAVYLIIIFSKPQLHVGWYLSALFVAITMILGSIIGVVFSTYDMCHEWGGYWSISFVICIVFEIFLFETIFMLIRWRILDYHRNSS